MRMSEIKKLALRGLLPVLCALMLLGPLTAVGRAVSTVTAQLRPDVAIVIDGSQRVFYNAAGQQVHPISYGGTTYLPLRAIGELMGKNVDWNQDTLTVTLSGRRTADATAGTPDKDAAVETVTAEVRDDFTIVLDGESRTFTDVNGKTVHPLLYNGSTYLPLRAIGGIMGGENSKITDSVKTVLFEAAIFNGPNVRKSSKRIGLRTDSSGKFEKGLEPHNAEDAINRACQLIEELGCGEAVGGMVDVAVPMSGKKVLPFRPEKYNRLLGTQLSAEEMLRILERLEIRILTGEKGGIELEIPYFRQDLNCDADIAEEVVRFYGYDKIPTTLPEGEATAGKLSYKLLIEEKARDIAEHCGFSQGMSYSFESPRVFDKLLLSEDDALRKTVTIANPLGEDFSIMRTIPLNGMLSSLATNYNRRNKNVRLYELENVYLPGELPLKELPDERMQFVLGFYGDGDFFTMKGVLEEFFAGVGMRKKPVYDPKAEKPFLHPGRRALVRYEETIVGYLGEVHPEVLDNYGIGTKAYVAVLDMPAVIPFTTFDRKYQGIAKYPAVSRDISMVVPKEILAGDIEQVIVQRGGKLLESCQLFDIYEGAQIQQGYKSIAYTITFRAKEKTLEDSEVNAVMKKILHGLEQMGIELRQ